MSHPVVLALFDNPSVAAAAARGLRGLPLPAAADLDLALDLDLERVPERLRDRAGLAEALVHLVAEALRGRVEAARVEQRLVHAGALPPTLQAVRAVDQAIEPAEPPEETNPWLKEGADAPDAADIEDPDEQR